MFATGGGDGVVNLWHDSTAYDKEEAFRKEVSKLISYLMSGQTYFSTYDLLFIIYL